MLKEDKVIKSTVAKFFEANASKESKLFVPELLPFPFLLLLFVHLCRTINMVSVRQKDLLTSSQQGLVSMGSDVSFTRSSIQSNEE